MARGGDYEPPPRAASPHTTAPRPQPSPSGNGAVVINSSSSSASATFLEISDFYVSGRPQSGTSSDGRNHQSDKKTKIQSSDTPREPITTASITASTAAASYGFASSLRAAPATIPISPALQQQQQQQAPASRGGTAAGAFFISAAAGQERRAEGQPQPQQQQARGLVSSLARLTPLKQ